MIARVVSKCVRSAYRSRRYVCIANQCQVYPKIAAFKFSTDAEFHEELDLKPFDVKDLLYEGSQDETIQRIKNCTTFEQLTPFVENVDNLEKTQHVCQLILSLNQARNETFNWELNLDRVVSRISQSLDQMTIEEIALSFHYLSKLAVSIKDPTLQAMTNILTKEIEKDELFSPNLLYHFTAALKSEKGLYASYLEVSVLPQIVKQLESCSNSEDFNCLTMCLTNISNIVALDLLHEYKRKTEEFLDRDILNESSPKIIMKAVNLLNFPHWSFRNAALIKRLILELQENISSLEARHLIVISKAFQSQYESARLIPHLVKRAQELLAVSPNVYLLPMAILDVTPDRRAKMTEIVKDFLMTYQIPSAQSGETLQTIFKILRLLKISDIDLCDSFWTKTLNELYATVETSLTFRLLRQVQKYMFFNNNLGGTYRHLEFERSMTLMLMKELRKTSNPKDYASFSSFIIAYGDVVGHRVIPQQIVDKIESLNEQFSIKDCAMISRGVQIMLETNYKQTSPELIDQLDSINFSLSKSTERHLKNSDLHLSELTSLVRSFAIRRGTKHSFVFQKLMKNFDTREKLELNSRSIREITYNLTSCNYRMDPMCDQFIDYILENWDHVTGVTVEKILTCCYNFSYFPEKLEVLDRSSEIFVRDFNYMNGLSIVQALLALIFYKACPQQLISMVFSSDFIKRLEQEIAMCYSKNTYPQRVMQQVMQLNRAVCLDCPEVNVKWFQQSYIEAQASKLPQIRSNVHKDVNSVLLSIVKVPDFLKVNRVTPYGYRVDFELTVDQYNRFVKPLPDDYHNINYQPNVHRIAVLLLNRKMLCDNDSNRLRGSELLRMRHLEMMGYRVVHLKVNDFKLMYRNVAARVKYIKGLLQLM